MGILKRVKDLKQSIEFKKAEREAKQLEKMNKKLSKLKKKESRLKAGESRKLRKKQLKKEIDRIEGKVSIQKKVTKRALKELSLTSKEIKNSKTYKETIKDLKSGITGDGKKKRKKRKKTTKKKKNRSKK